MAVETDDRPGIDRRTMIRRAAAAGAVAWTAPVIIGSLTSPAAALTGPCGCNLVRFNGNCTPNCNGVPCGNNVPVCVPSTTGACQELQACVTPTTTDCDGQPNAVTFQILSGCTCTFEFGTGNSSNGTICNLGVPNATKQTITFPALPTGPGTVGYNQFVLQVKCGPGCPPE